MGLMCELYPLQNGSGSYVVTNIPPQTGPAEGNLLRVLVSTASVNHGVYY